MNFSQKLASYLMPFIILLPEKAPASSQSKSSRNQVYFLFHSHCALLGLSNDLFQEKKEEKTVIAHNPGQTHPVVGNSSDAGFAISFPLSLWTTLATIYTPAVTAVSPWCLKVVVWRHLAFFIHLDNLTSKDPPKVSSEPTLPLELHKYNMPSHRPRPAS